MATQISGVAFTELRQLAPPFVDGNGNLYFVGILSTDYSKLAMMKSSNGGTSWSEVDSANRPDDSETIYCIDAFQDGDVIHIATQTKTNGYLRYSTFQTSDHSSADVWGTKLTAISTCSLLDDITGCSIVVRGDGNIVIFYNGDTTSGKSSVYYAKYVSSWTVDIAVQTSSTYDYFVHGACLGEDDKIYLAYTRSPTSNWGCYKSLSSSYTLSALKYGGTDAHAYAFNGAKPVYYDADGVERISCIWNVDTTGYEWLYEIEDDGAAGDTVLIGYFIEKHLVSGTKGGSHAVYLAVDADEKTIYCIYAGNANDIYYMKRVDSGFAASQVELNDAVTADERGGVVANVYQNGSNVVLAYVFNDGGSYYYDELTLRTLPLDASTSDGVSVSENVEMKPLLGIAVKDYYYRRRRIS